jgi:1-acyl-sn-glycerol-3-phosphate acyltransferase
VIISSECNSKMISLTDMHQFREQLVKTGGYKTPEDFPVSPLGRFDFWYYLRGARIVWEGSRLAKQGLYTDEVWAAHSLSTLRNVEVCGGKFEISGIAHPTEHGQPAVIVGNHMSMVEGFLLPIMLLHINRLAAVVKQDLLDHPILGPVMHATDTITVGRTNPRQDLKTVLEEGRRCLDEGRSVTIFPQSTRSTHFDPAQFNSLGVKLAKAAGVAVIPLALKTDFQSNGRILKDLGPLHRERTLHLKFGAPLTVSGNGRDTHNAVVEFISQQLADWSRA